MADLLSYLEKELATIDEEVVILFSDNCSEDETPEVISEYAKRLPISSFRQETNIGGPANAGWVLGNAPDSEYVWAFGDDDRPEPGALPKIITLLKENNPTWLHMPHYWKNPDGAVTSGSPLPDALLRYPNSGDMYRQWGHWLTFLSASILRRENIVRAVREHPTKNAYSPLVWFFWAALNEPCLVANERLVWGSSEISWMHLHSEYTTRHFVALFDEAVSASLSAAEFAASLDTLYGEGDFLKSWRDVPHEELEVAVERFPWSRCLREFLFILAQERSRPESYAILDDACIASGVAMEATAAISRGEGAFSRSDMIAALGEFEQAVRLHPTSSLAWNDRGVILHEIGQLDAARQSFTMAIVLDPKNEDAHQNLESM